MAMPDTSIDWAFIKQEPNDATIPYLSTSPHYCFAMRPQSSSYPTTPQSCAHTDSNSVSSSLATGVGPLDPTSNHQETLVSSAPSSSSLLESTQTWLERGPTADTCFPNTPSTFMSYPGLSVYEGLRMVPNTSMSSFNIQGTGIDTSSTEFLSPVPLMKVASSSTTQSNIYAHDMAFNYGVTPSPVQSPHIHNEDMSDDWKIITTDNPAKQAFYGIGGVPLFRQQLSPPTSTKHPRDTSAPAPSLAPISTETKSTHCQLRTSNSSKKTEKRPSALTQSSAGVKKVGKKSDSGKYECELCGRLFTRNSNCRSHMKIHDPNRRYPHECTIGQCTNKFSRKTDLIRHIDSVHKKLKRFGCEHCGNRFARQDTLRRHREDGCRRQQQYRQAQEQEEQKQQQQQHHHSSQRAQKGEAQVTQRQQQLILPTTQGGMDDVKTYSTVSTTYREPILAYDTHSPSHSDFVRPYLDTKNETHPEHLRQ